MLTSAEKRNNCKRATLTLAIVLLRNFPLHFSSQHFVGILEKNNLMKDEAVIKNNRCN
jgi:hypothetical protein